MLLCLFSSFWIDRTKLQNWRWHPSGHADDSESLESPKQLQHMAQWIKVLRGDAGDRESLL